MTIKEKKIYLLLMGWEIKNKRYVNKAIFDNKYFHSQFGKLDSDKLWKDYITKLKFGFTLKDAYDATIKYLN